MSQKWWAVLRKLCFPCITRQINAHRNSQRQGQYAQDLNSFKPDGGERSTKSHPFANDSYWARENQVSSVEWHWLYQAHPRTGPLLSSWPTQIELHDFSSSCLLVVVMVVFIERKIPRSSGKGEDLGGVREQERT